MKKLICTLLILCLLGCTAFAENAGTAFNNSSISVVLPEGMRILDALELEGYEAALQADFPGSGETIMAAIGPDASSAVTISSVSGEQSGIDAAREAAAKILGNDSTVREVILGKNHYGSFSCAVGDLQFDLYYLSGNGQTIIIGTSGMDRSEADAMLSGILF